MGEKWVSVLRGIRYREHSERRIGAGRNARADRYYVIRYSRDGVTRQEGVGWESEGYSVEEAVHLLGVVRRGIKDGQGPVSLAEIRGAEKARVEAEKRAVLGDVVGTDLTFRAVAAIWSREVGEDLKSWKADRSRMDLHVLPVCGDMLVTEMDLGHVRDIARKLARRKVSRGGSLLAPGTVRHCVILIGRVLEFARTVPVQVGGERRVILNGPNPVHGFRMRKVDNARWRVATDKEVSAILEYCREHGGPLAPVYRLAVLLALGCGARLDEVVGIRLEHLDRPRGRVRLVDTKNSESRFVYPPEATMGEVLAQEKRARSQGSPWLFPSSAARGGHVHKDSVGHFFSDACTALGFNQGVDDRRGKLVFHSLRHTFGTRQVMAGTGLMVLRKLMGHRSLSTTERYVHLAEEFVAASQR